MKTWTQLIDFFREEVWPSFLRKLQLLGVVCLGIFGFCILIGVLSYFPWSNEYWSIQPLAQILSPKTNSSAAAFCGFGSLPYWIPKIVLSFVVLVMGLVVYLCWSSRVFLWAFLLSFVKLLRQGLLNYSLGKDVLVFWPFTKSPLMVRRWSSEEKIQLVEERIQRLCEQQQCASNFLPENFLKTEALSLDSRASIEALVNDQFQVHYELYLKVLRAPLPYHWTDLCYDFARHLYHDPALGLALSFGLYILYKYFFGKPPTDV